MPRAVIVDHDPAWSIRARQLLSTVRSAFASRAGANDFVYDHIGSTAVPGLAAKPIVDLQVRMPTLPSMAELTDVLAPTPFIPAQGARADSPGVHRDIPRPGDPVDAALYEKRLFHSPADPAILHIRRADSPFAQFVVDFRDWLRQRPDQARRYEQVKRDLAREHAGDPDYDDYTRAKSTFLNEIQPQLRDWASSLTESVHQEAE
jgi:dephospho-CoA kinase